jgi:hypothetical protein
MLKEGGPAALPGPSSFVVWGSKRADLDRLAIALAKALAKEVFWVDIQMDASFSTGETNVLQDLDPSHSFRVAPADVALDERLGKLALWAVVQEPATSAENMRLSDYLRIPGAFRSVIDRTGPVAGGVAIVVANVDRATGFYTGTPGEFTPFLQELKRLEVSVIFTNAGIPRGNTSDFDAVFRVTPAPAGEGANVYCSHADSRFADRFEVGTEVPFDDLLAALVTTG